jgi:peptidoglycan/LPS O-acetylase OafA/YrhL
LTLQLNTGHEYTGWGHNLLPIGPIWTIAVEFQFYLIFPFLIKFHHESNGRFTIQLIATMIIIKAMMTTLSGPSIYYNLYHTLIGRLDQFLVGILAGSAYIQGKRPNKAQKWIAITSALVGLTFIFTQRKETYISCTLGLTAEAVCWAILLYAYITSASTSDGPVSRALARAGEVSFSLYLLHNPLGSALNKALHLPLPTDLVSTVLIAALKMALILPVCFLTYASLERPFLSMRSSYLHAKREP